METTPFNFTTEQKDLLQSLSQEMGKSISALIEEALKRLREDVRLMNRNTNGSQAENGEISSPLAPQPRKPIWELFEEASHNIPDEELDRLSTDGSYQHDHYLYGTPKHPA